MMLTGRIHSFESCGTVDGPGIRFVVFMQGCPLRCLYCHNRDTWDARGGREVEVADVMREILKYRSYMRFSGGGVTITGGEPLLQAEFVRELLRECKRAQIHAAVDTSGYAPIEKARPVLEVADLVLLDLKCMNAETHQRLTGRELAVVLRFAHAVSEMGKPLWIRHVLVPGWTDREEFLRQLGEFIASLKTVEAVELLPFHKMGEYKWAELGCQYSLSDVSPPTKTQVKHALDILKAYSPNVR